MCGYYSSTMERTATSSYVALGWRAAAALLLTAALACPAAALAHKGKEKRGALATVRLEKTKEGKEQIRVDALVWLRLPASERVRSLRARFDLNRSGRFESAEAKLLGNELGAEVIGGYVMRYRGGGLTPQDARPSARFEEDGALTLLALLSYPPIPPSSDGADLAIAVLPPLRAKGRDLRRPLSAEIRVNPPLRYSPPTLRKATVAPGREPLRVRVFLADTAKSTPAAGDSKRPAGRSGSTTKEQ